MKVAVWKWLAIGLLAGTIMPQLRAQATSTPEEQTRWAAITHKLEASPLDESTNKDGEWAIQRVTDVHDFHVPLCLGLFTEFKGLNYTYQHQILRQYMLASAAFLIENPGKAGDLNAMNLAALESVLKSYSAILAEKPEAKSKVLDGLLKRQSEGKLDGAIDKNCK